MPQWDTPARESVGWWVWRWGAVHIPNRGAGKGLKTSHLSHVCKSKLPLIFPLLPLYPQKIYLCFLTHCQALCLPLCPSACLSTGLPRFFQDMFPYSFLWVFAGSLLPPTLSKNTEVTATKKLQHLCNLMSYSHRFRVVSSNSRCLVTICSGPGHYFTPFYMYGFHSMVRHRSNSMSAASIFLYIYFQKTSCYLIFISSSVFTGWFFRQSKKKM